MEALNGNRADERWLAGSLAVLCAHPPERQTEFKLSI